MKTKWKKVIGVGCIIGATLCLSGCGKTSINMNDYFEYEIEGYEGYGTISSYVDADQAIMDNEKAFGNFDVDAEDADALDAFNAVVLMEEIDGEWSQSDSLSNGDTVTFKWDESTIEAVEDRYDVKLKHSDVKVTIEGLEKVQTYDAFKGLGIKYSNIAPWGKVSLHTADCGIPNLQYTAEPTTGLKNGDKMTVTVEVPDDCAEEYGKVPKETTKTYKVEGLTSFVTSTADIPEETMNAMKKQAEDVKKSGFEKHKSDDEVLNSMTYVGNYFLTMKDDVAKDENFSLDSRYDIYNSIYLIYEMNVSNKEGTYSYYWYCSFNNIAFLDDGTCSVDTSNYNEPDEGLLGDEGISLGSRQYAGHKDKTSLFSKCVTQNSAEYNYENNVDSEQNTDAEKKSDAKQEETDEQS